MIHIAIDTSGVVGGERSFKSAHFLALKRLVEHSLVKIHVPYIVKREFDTQQEAFFLDHYKTFEKSIKLFKKAPKSSQTSHYYQGVHDQFQAITQNLESESQSFSRRWMQELQCQIHDIDAQQAKEAFEAYFNGTAPLTSPKNRLDIPDSFICRNFEKIKKEINQPLSLIVNDNKIINTFRNTNGFEIFKNISEFILSDEVQSKLKALNIVDDQMGDIRDFIIKYENKTNHLKDFIAVNIGESVWNKSVYGIPLANDADGEATISMYDAGYNIIINFENPIHYGENQIGFTFESELDVQIDFFVDKNDYYMEYYADDNSNISGTHVEDWNDHVFHAETDANLKITGIVSVKVDKEKLDLSEISQLNKEELEDYFHDVYLESESEIESIDENNINLI